MSVVKSLLILPAKGIGPSFWSRDGSSVGLYFICLNKNVTVK